MDPAARVPLAVTTSDRVDPDLAARARAAAQEAGVPFVARHHKLPLARLLAETADALVVFEAGAVSLVDARGSLRYSPGLAHLRIRQLDAGVEEDMLLRAAQLRPGERVLDCTLGLGADAQVAARLVGPTGSVVALEKSAAVFLLVKHGLAGLPPRAAACSVDVRLADAHAFLRATPPRAYDVVLFDPMFERPRKSSVAFETLRRHADVSALTVETLQEARRVARRAVVLKGSRYSQDLRKLGVTALPARPNATVVWACVPAV